MARAINTPTASVTFRDPEQDVEAYLVVDRLVDGLAAGGLRLHADVSLSEVTELAATMSAKQAAAGIRVGGAKAGVRMDPGSKHRRAVLSRFLEFLSPLVNSNVSLGPDLNTSLPELEELGVPLGIPCLKIAVGRRRGLADQAFLRRYALFQERLPLGTVNQLRAPQAVATATLVLLEQLDVPVDRARIAIQGAGNMGAGTALLLAEAGARVVAWADDQKCRFDEAGLETAKLHGLRVAGRLPGTPKDLPSGKVLTTPCDVLILAAVSRAFGVASARDLRCRGVVEAANVALAPEVEDALHLSGVRVVPDLLASVGGSLAVEALYLGQPSSGRAILDHVATRMRALVGELLRQSALTGSPPRRLLTARSS